MSAGFTPGPWRVGYGPNERDCFPQGGERHTELCCLPHSTHDALDVFAPGTGADDWEVSHSEPTWDELLANARLIAAAPELYEAVQWALTHQDECLGDHPDRADAFEQLLAKARGEQ